MRDALHGYPNRARELLRAGAYDLVWIEKEALPWIPAVLERSLLRRKVPYVLDYDDAVFHQYDLSSSRLVRMILGRKHPQLMQGATLVIAGNEYLADFARVSGGSAVHVLPTVVDLDRYPGLPHSPGASGPPRVGWIGQRATAECLLPLRETFAGLAADGLARFRAIGVDAQCLGLPMESVLWSEESESRLVAELDVGIMPLNDRPFERGKCGYKLIQYMACGLPVIASPVGVNTKIVRHGVNGFLAETPAEWEKALRTLLADPELRRRMGQEGRKQVEQEYCIQVTGPVLASLLKQALTRHH
jgi:glycosyltransferase involved in cell wall biosynthesis